VRPENRNIGVAGPRASVTVVERAEQHNPFWDSPGVRFESRRSWRSISAEIVSRTAGTAVWRSDCHRIVYALTDIHGAIRNNAGPVLHWDVNRDSFAFRPGGVALESTVEEPVRFVQIAQNPDVYDDICSELLRGGRVGLEPRAGLHDPLLSQIALTIANEIETEFADHILADALNTALAVQIVRRFVDPSAIALEPASGLSRERLKRVLDYIEAHLEARLTLTDLAAVACLSSYHFSRSFKQAVGVGPQRYVMQRRVERAKALIRRTDQPLASIAQAVGFADQSHLTSVFRREIGITPGHFRAALA
jgi:AraC-like DNA-binding protein